MNIVKTIKIVFKREAVLCICSVLALGSMFLVPPSAEYAKYIDLKVLCLLFCLMAVVLGLQECGLFKVLAQKLLTGRKRFQIISLVLVLLPFFSSMLITNDVALITFVPFAILVLTMIGRSRDIVKTVVLQTMAANLGSMATPIGSPHNLFLYSFYKLSAGEFFSLMVPLTGISLIGLVAAVIFKKDKPISIHFEHKAHLKKPKLLVMFIGLFLICLTSVFNVLSFWIPTAVVLLCMLVFSRKLLKKVDYSLLLTFVCFFVFVGNISQVPLVRDSLSGLLEGKALLTTILASQAISNVPAAVLLSGFTDDWRSLLIGTNIGGLGTPIASLASLISFRIYNRSEGARPMYYLGVFTIANIIGILVLLAFVWLI